MTTKYREQEKLSSKTVFILFVAFSSKLFGRLQVVRVVSIHVPGRYLIAYLISASRKGGPIYLTSMTILSSVLWVVIVSLLNIVALGGLEASAIATDYYTCRRVMKFVCAANLRLARRKPGTNSTANNSVLHRFRFYFARCIMSIHLLLPLCLFLVCFWSCISIHYFIPTYSIQ